MARILHSSVICSNCSSFSAAAAERSLFPGAHVCINGHTVVRSVAQLLLTYLCTAGGTQNKQDQNSGNKYAIIPQKSFIQMAAGQYCTVPWIVGQIKCARTCGRLWKCICRFRAKYKKIKKTHSITHFRFFFQEKVQVVLTPVCLTICRWVLEVDFYR